MGYFLAWHPDRYAAGQLFPRGRAGYPTRQVALSTGEALGRASTWTILEATDRDQALRLAAALGRRVTASVGHGNGRAGSNRRRPTDRMCPQ